MVLAYVRRNDEDLFGIDVPNEINTVIYLSECIHCVDHLSYFHHWIFVLTSVSSSIQTMSKFRVIWAFTDPAESDPIFSDFVLLLCMMSVNSTDEINPAIYMMSCQVLFEIFLMTQRLYFFYHYQ